MKKITEKIFRNYIANAFIILIFVCLFSLSFLGQVTYVFNSNGYSPLYNGNKNSTKVSLMFNVYMGTEYIDDILTCLNESNSKATFFVGGSWAIKNSDTLKKILDNGHEIGNHGYWHKDHKMISYEKNLSEIELTHKLVKELLNYDISLFAPPSGSFGNNTLKAAQQMGYKTIMWTKDTIDWRDKDSSLIYSRAIKNPSGGDFILMHPTGCTLKALPDIISFYTQSGYKLTTVSENIAQ